MGFTELKSWLRHRHPMIYLDRVLDHEPGVALTSMLSVSGNMDSVAGHFPERAIFPASHLTQAMAQSAIILLQVSTTPLADDEITLVGTMKARFTKIVVPGDQVVIVTQADEQVDPTFTYTCRATVDSTPVAACQLTLVRLKVEQLGEQFW
jgi:3-hydroxymyristoyl/3-hydroxydecanoyl-(acyl carrier protein) dehydratase